ncbi:STAM-binding protein-like isoform X2 [Hydra vulgaris]|uniref:STAM-binding protein-like isoform X2 n=1 Tax=Hydra vulgaris TaxID=6087 RepID=A0ABM4BWN7_HYDVU
MDPSARLKILTNKANDFPFDIKIPVIRYARSLKELERMAIIYAQESQVENAFILYMKLITLSVEKLPKHPQFSALDAEQRSIIKKRCALAITIAEGLKKEIKQLYEEEYQQWIEDKQAEVKSGSQKITYVALQDNNNSHSSESQSPDSFASESSSHTFSQNQKLIPSQNQDDNKIILPSYSTISLDQPSISVCSTIPHVNPTAPPFKDFVDDNTLFLDDFKNTQYKQSDTFIQPNVNRSTKPLSMINDLKNNHEAASNTKRNIETCGILCGRLVQSQFRVTHLIIPKQHGTSDSCTTEKEEEMFDVQDKYDLITVGWIHTHPSQTCFLSSVDLHTQCSYQQLLPEAVAVVCSPKYNTFGVYRLTMHGLKLITNCTQNGFHPHNKDPPLFEESSGINIQDSYGITIVDLR